MPKGIYNHYKIKGIPKSEEHNEKNRLAHLGKPMPFGFQNKEKNHMWKGGITPLNEKIRKCFKYRQWRADCFTRDDYTCQICGFRGGYMEVDHYPKMLYQIRDENSIKTLEEALACDELWNINGGRTLCRKCHDKTKNGRPKKNKDIF